MNIIAALLIVPIFILVIYLIKKLLCLQQHKYVPDHMTPGSDTFYAVCKRCGKTEKFPVSSDIMQKWDGRTEKTGIFDWYR